jgi:hypothetical protein
MRRWTLGVVACLLVATAAWAAPAAGSGWSVVRSPNPKAGTGQLFSVVCVGRSRCVAVGSHVRQSGVGVTLAERWSGRRWSVLRSPNPAGARVSILNGVACTTPRFCMAVGEFFGRSGVHRTLAETWRGGRWRIESTPRPPGRPVSSSLLGVSCASRRSCLAVGRSGSTLLVERWDGTGWRLVRAPDPSHGQFSELVSVSCRASSGCVAVGDYVNSAGADVTLADRWNGRKWTVLPTPNPAGAQFAFFGGVTCGDKSSCVAVGGSDAGTLVEHWDGRKWRITPTPDPSGAQFSELFSVACPRASACSAVGGYLNGQGAFLTLAEQWNGHSWRVKPSPSPPGDTGNFLGGVSCPRVRSCIAVGQVNGDGTPRALAEQWNGAQWRMRSAVSPRGAAETQLNGVSCPKRRFCIAVGTAGPTAGTTSSVAERWEGKAWRLQAIPTLPGANLNAVSCASASSCIAVGGSNSGTLAEQWNGTRWRILPTQPPPGAQGAGFGGVDCTSARACIATGAYNAPSGNVLSLAERWNGSSWRILPTPNPRRAVQSFLGGVSCSSASACTTVGEQHSASGIVHTLAERWNGRSWRVQPTPNPRGVQFASLPDVSCTSNSHCLAVGGSDQGTLAELWNGTRWRIQATPTPAPGASFSSVDCPAGSVCTAVGFYFTDRGGEVLAERLQGSRWHVQSTPLLPGAHDISPPAVACLARSSCTAVGGYENDGPGSITLTEQWNGGHKNRPTTMSSRVAADDQANGACRSGIGVTRNNTAPLFLSLLVDTRSTGHQRLSTCRPSLSTRDLMGRVSNRTLDLSMTS